MAAELLEGLIQQLRGPLAIMSLAAEVLCRLLSAQAVDEFHLVLQPCVPLLLGIVSRHRRAPPCAPGPRECCCSGLCSSCGQPAARRNALPVPRRAWR